MLERYLEEIFGKMEASREQREIVLEMLEKIQLDDALFSELQRRRQKAKNQNSEDNSTLFHVDIQLDAEYKTESISVEESSFAGDATFNLELDLEDEALEEFDNLAGVGKASEPLTGLQLGRYLDLGVLGEGGMGEVRRVRDEVLKRDLAMKIVYPNILGKSDELARFIEEAQIGAQLQHPNIVPIYELGSLPDGRYYFTMKEIKGIEFKELIRAVHASSTDQVWKTAPDGTSFRRLIQIFHTMCETMAFAHSLGVIHRDLKPQNVMIGDFGEVLIVDWGIAKIIGKINGEGNELVQTDRHQADGMATRVGIITGTPAYMSPEQANGENNKLSAQSDIYTLGAILYEILSGKPPYLGKSAADIVKKVQSSKPRSLLTSSSSIDKELDFARKPPVLEDIETGKLPLDLIRICERAMEREINGRYASASDLAQDIFDWLEGAQKRDKALKELEKAAKLFERIGEKRLEYQKNWQRANEKIAAQNYAQIQSWYEWEQGEKIRQETLQLQRDYRYLIQGALVYDPGFEEAHEALAELSLKSVITALAAGNQEEQAIHEKQLQRHLQYLSNKRKEELLLQLEEKKQDDILLLRSQQGSLIGRQKIREKIALALEKQHRLISLVGTAGVGKTRLGLEIIYDLQEPETSSYFCNLTEADSELGVALLVARVMNIKLRNIDPVGHLGEIFSEQKTILVLDNLEQVISPAAGVIQRWLEQSDQLRIIATSRIKLRLPEEQVFLIQPLSLLEGMELFVNRGQKADRQFMLNAESRIIVASLVQQLDSLPLAIELAAARLNIFSVQEVADRLKQRFSLLRSREKGAQALQGALDWSWELLKPWTKSVLSQASVFHSGFDIDAAESILVSEQWKEAPAVFDILQDLCENSLLQSRSVEGSIRYGMLESIRQYSKGKLENDSEKEAVRQVERRHAEYYSRFGDKEYLDSLENQGSPQKWTYFLGELDNFIAGTVYGGGFSATQCCIAALKVLGMKGPISLGVEVLKQTLKKDSLSAHQQRQLRIYLTRFLRISGRMDEARDIRKQIEEDNLIFPISKKSETDELRLWADELLEKGNFEENDASYAKALDYYVEAQNIYQIIQDRKGFVEIYQKIARVFKLQGQYGESLKKLEEGLQLAKENEFISIEAMILASFGEVYQEISEYQKAIECYHLALDINRQLKDRFAQGSNFGNLGNVYRDLGRYQEAIQSFKQSIALANEVGDKRVAGIHLGNLGLVYQNIGQTEKTVQYVKEAIAVVQEIGDKRSEGIHTGNLGGALLSLERWEEAEKAFEVAIEICDETLPPGAAVFRGALAWLYAQRDRLQEAWFLIEKAEEPVQAIPSEYGKFLCVKAKIASLMNQPKLAQEALEKAEAVGVELQLTAESAFGRLLEETRDFLKDS